MDAHVDYLVQEMQGNYSRVYNFISNAGVSLNDASDEVVYRFEVHGSVLGGGGLLPREHSARSEERRVGKECVSRSRSRWSLDLAKNNNIHKYYCELI